MSLLELFRPLGLSLQATENVMNLPPDHELYPKRVYESDDYKEALKELKEAKAEYDKYHGKVIDVLQLDEMLMKANKKGLFIQSDERCMIEGQGWNQPLISS